MYINFCSPFKKKKRHYVCHLAFFTYYIWDSFRVRTESFLNLFYSCVVLHCSCVFYQVSGSPLPTDFRIIEFESWKVLANIYVPTPSVYRKGY